MSAPRVSPLRGFQFCGAQEKCDAHRKAPTGPSSCSLHDWLSTSGCIRTHTRRAPYNRVNMKQVVHAACPHDCPDACGVLITVEDGRATKIQGDPEHPVTQGFLCAKVAKYLDRVYSPDRVLYPMRRIGPKGPISQSGAGCVNAFQRITWD